MSSTDTWECGHSWDSYILRFLPLWSNLKSSASTCAWSVTLELSAFSRQKAFQTSFDLFSIWLTLLWTGPMRFPTILSLFSQHTCTTCLFDLVPSQHASSPSAFATAHSENEKQARRKEARVHSRQSPSPSLQSAGHLLITMRGPIVSAQEGIYGSLGFKWMFMSLVWQSKGRHYPRFYSHSHGSAFGCACLLWLVLRYGVSLCVSGSVIFKSLYVYYQGLNQYSVSRSVCLFYRTQRSHKVHNFEGGNSILLLCRLRVSWFHDLQYVVSNYQHDKQILPCSDCWIYG